MTVTTRYLCGHVLIRFVGSLIVFTALALLFDLLDAGDDLLDDGINGIIDLLTYIALRLPSLVSQMMPIACLAGGLLSVTALLRHRELVALWAFGHSPYAIMKKLIPLLVLLSAVQFVIDDRLVPPTVAELRLWQVGQFKTPLSGAGGRYLWMRSGQDILRFPATLHDTSELENVTIFRRDSAGILESRWHVERAFEDEDGWRLENITITPTSGGDEFLPNAFWEGEIDTSRLALLATPPRELSAATLWMIIDAEAFNLRPLRGYIVWLHARFALIVLLPIMLVLPFAMVREAPRRQAWLSLHLPAVAIGFCAIVFGGLAIALGESGLVNPYLAAWGPISLLAALVLMLPAWGTRSPAARATG